MHSAQNPKSHHLFYFLLCFGLTPHRTTQNLFSLFLICFLSGLTIWQEKSQSSTGYNHLRGSELLIYWRWLFCVWKDFWVEDYNGLKPFKKNKSPVLNWEDQHVPGSSVDRCCDCNKSYNIISSLTRPYSIKLHPSQKSISTNIKPSQTCCICFYADYSICIIDLV